MGISRGFLYFQSPSKLWWQEMASDTPVMWIESSAASESMRRSHSVSYHAVLSTNKPCMSNDFIYFYWLLKDNKNKTDADDDDDDSSPNNGCVALFICVAFAALTENPCRRKECCGSALPSYFIQVSLTQRRRLVGIQSYPQGMVKKGKKVVVVVCPMRHT